MANQQNSTRKRLESGNGRGFAIVIKVQNSIKALKLCFKGLRFEKALKIVEKYWKAGPGLVYMYCVDVGHNCMGKCKNRAIQ